MSVSFRAVAIDTEDMGEFLALSDAEFAETKARNKAIKDGKDLICREYI